MPPTPKGPAAAAGLLIPCLGSVEGETGVRSRDWRPVESVLRSEVWFSIDSLDVAESFLS
jgi:hypothetical protein